MNAELARVRPAEVASPALLEMARKALSEAETLPEVAAIVDRAEAIRAVARKARLGLEARNNWAVFTLQAQREGGRMLAEMIRTGRPEKGLHGATLSDFGIEKTASHRWQRLALLPEAEFEAWTATVREAEEEITAAKALRVARKYQPPQTRKQAKEEATTTTPAEPPTPPVRPGSTAYKRAPDAYIVSQAIPRLTAIGAELGKVDTAAFDSYASTLSAEQQREVRDALGAAIKSLRRVRDSFAPRRATTATHARLLDLIRAAGEKGRTDSELEADTGLGANTIRPRRGELVTAGLVVDSGKQRDGTTVWQATQQP